MQVRIERRAETLSERDHPLAHRHLRENPLVRVRGRLGHASRGAGGTHAPILAGKGDQEVVTTATASPVGAEQATSVKRGGDVIEADIEHVGLLRNRCVKKG
jgi:hypothetical protein